jgi:hypothetical protein
VRACALSTVSHLFPTHSADTESSTELNKKITLLVQACIAKEVSASMEVCMSCVDMHMHEHVRVCVCACGRRHVRLELAQ